MTVANVEPVPATSPHLGLDRPTLTEGELAVLGRALLGVGPTVGSVGSLARNIGRTVGTFEPIERAVFDHMASGHLTMRVAGSMGLSVDEVAETWSSVVRRIGRSLWASFGGIEAFSGPPVAALRIEGLQVAADSRGLANSFLWGVSAAVGRKADKASAAQHLSVHRRRRAASARGAVVQLRGRLLSSRL